MSFDTATSGPSPSPSPSPPPSSPGDDVTASDISEEVASGLNDIVDQVLLTAIETGAAQLLSTAASDGLLDAFSRSLGGWFNDAPEMDPYTGAALANGIADPFVGLNVDPFTNAVSDALNMNAFTGGQNVEPFTGLQNVSFTPYPADVTAAGYSNQEGSGTGPVGLTPEEQAQLDAALAQGSDRKIVEGTPANLPSLPPLDDSPALPTTPEARETTDNKLAIELTPEEERNLRTNAQVLGAIEREFERDANTGVHAKPIVDPNTDPDSLIVAWVFKPEHPVGPQLERVPDTGSDILNYGVGILYSWRNLFSAIDSWPLDALGVVNDANKELERLGIPLEAIPGDAAPAFLAEQADYLAARASQAFNSSRLTIPVPGLAAGGIGLVPIRIGGTNSAPRAASQAPKIYIDKYLTERLQTYTSQAGGAARSNPSAFLGFNTAKTPPFIVRFQIGHQVERSVGEELAKDPVLSRVIEAIPYKEQSAGKGLLGDFRLTQPFQDMWNLKQWDVTTPGGAWTKVLNGADRTWLLY